MIIRDISLRLFCTVLCCLLLCVCSVFPQQKQTRDVFSPPLRFQHFGADEGLPQNAVVCMVQDRFGYMWFGTQDGLARFDGYGFTVIRHNPLDSTTLSSSDIRSLLESRAGDLWIGTTNGVNHYHRATGKITRYLHNPSDPKSLSHNETWSMLEDRAGVIWVGTSGGLNRFDAATKTFTRFQNESGNAASLSNNFVFSLLEDSFGKLWIGTDNGVNSFDRSTGKCTRYQHNAVNPRSLSSNNFVKTLLEDRSSGTLWVGTQTGLNRFDRATGTFTRYLHNADDRTSLSNNNILSLCEDRIGVLWVGTEEGLNAFDRTTGTFARYLHNATNPASLSNDRILSLWEDRSYGNRAGILWIGTRNGLNCLDRSGEKFIHFKHNPLDSSSLSNNEVWAILEERTNNRSLWVGTRGGLNCFDRRTGKWQHFLHNLKDESSLSDNEVWSLLEDHHGTLWAGTRNGLSCFHRKTGKFKRFMNNPRDSTSLIQNGVFSLFEDREGIIWVGTGGGACRLDPASGRFVRYKHDPADSTSLSGNVVNIFFEDRAGNIWVGTRGGLNRFDRITGQFRRYLHNDTDTTSLSNNLVASITEDRKHDGIFWIGTFGGGLNRFDRATGVFTVFREKDGLPNDTVLGVVEDDAGNLWIATIKGLCKCNPLKRTFVTYGKRDGLQDDEINSGAYHYGKSGRMYVGGGLGCNEFYPDNVRPDSTPPPVVITAFKKFNQTTTLDSAIEKKHTISLLHNENDIGFEFAALSFHLPERNQYQYKLDGYDNAWSSAGTERKATYTNLDPGDYVFRVRASNSDGVWNHEGASIRISILPPWWARWWARSGFVLCFLGGLFQAYRLRVRVLERRNERLQKQVSERTKELQLANTSFREINDKLEDAIEELTVLGSEKDEFMGIAVHDLRNPIGGIRSLALLLESAQTLTPEKVQSIGAMMRKSSDTMLTLIGNLLNVNELERGAAQFSPETFDISLLLRDIADDYADRATAKNITIQYAENTPEARVYGDRTACLQIFDNIISNAVKYSPRGKRIWIDVNAGKDGMVRVMVKDEGAGFSIEDKQRLFGKFARLSNEPTGGEQRTGLGLSIVKRLVEAQSGRVWCESELGRGATFVVELPSA